MTLILKDVNKQVPFAGRTLKELWSFYAGSGINAPAISYAVNGKQYVAVLVGSKMSENVLAQSPELKNNNSASMLFVFSL